ncbi:urease accessory protein UreE [Luteolibacter algae]|uniref:Urease accessory protein UreE n=1 Tax=Luteolibacter algae TaxID=454151 RepID=A0ABW5DAJ0_9BACT
MRLIEKMLASRSEKAAGDRVELAVERRLFLKRRWRGVAEDGSEFGFDLESRLIDGCVIYQNGGKDYIVRQLPEPVYEVPFTDTAHAALVGWKVGNLHLPAQVMMGALRVLHDEAMAHLLAREGWDFSEPVVIFTPMKAIAHS